MACDRSTLKAHLAILLCNVVWACDYPFYNLVLGRYVEPVAMVTGSLIVAAALSFIPAIWQPSERIQRSDWPVIIIAALMIGVARKLLLMYGLSRTSPIDGSIISTVAPLIVLPLSALCGVDRITTRKAIGLVIGLLGAVAVIVSGRNSSHHNSDTAGNLMLFCGTCVTALYMVFFKHLVARYRITTLLRLIYTISAIAMLPFGARSLLDISFEAMDTRILLATLFVLIVPTYLPNLLLNYSLRYVAPTLTSIYAYIQPLLAITLSVAMGLDHLHLDTLLFGSVVFLGVGLVISAYKERPRT